MKSSPRSPQLENACVQQKDPARSKKKKKKVIATKGWRVVTMGDGRSKWDLLLIRQEETGLLGSILSLDLGHSFISVRLLIICQLYVWYMEFLICILSCISLSLHIHEKDDIVYAISYIVRICSSIDYIFVSFTFSLIGLSLQKFFIKICRYLSCRKSYRYFPHHLLLLFYGISYHIQNNIFIVKCILQLWLKKIFLTPKCFFNI